MKKLSGVIAIAILLFALVVYAFVYFFAIPETAAQLIPYKWRSVSTGQNKVNYENYLGKQVNNAEVQQITSDQWVLRNGNYSFFLTIDYNADTVGKTVLIKYQFSNNLFYKEGVLKTVK